MIYSADDDEYTRRYFTYSEKVLYFDKTFDAVVVDACDDAFNRRKRIWYNLVAKIKIVNIDKYTKNLLNTLLIAVLTNGEHRDDFLNRFFVFRRHMSPYANRPDKIFSKRQYDYGHFGGTDVHDAYP